MIKPFLYLYLKFIFIPQVLIICIRLNYKITNKQNQNSHISKHLIKSTEYLCGPNTLENLSQRMTLKNRKYKLQKLKGQHDTYLKKQQNFNNRLTVMQKKTDYNALQDPHASYYFVNKSVRNHLKKIKNAAINETTHSMERQKLKKLFNQKIKFKPKNLFASKPGVYLLEQLLTNQALRKGSIRTVQSQRSKTPRKFSQRANDTNDIDFQRHNQSLSKRNFPTLTQELKTSQTIDNQEQMFGVRRRDSVDGPEIKGINFKQESILKHKKAKYQKVHEIKHKKFISFIQEKKNLVMRLKQSLQPSLRVDMDKI